MNGMYHDSADLPGGLTVYEAATALAVQDLYALRAVAAAMHADLAALDPFGAQSETAADVIERIERAVRSDAVVDSLCDGRVDYFALGVARVDWRGWGANDGLTDWERTMARWGVLSDELRRLAAEMDGSGLSDAAMSVSVAAGDAEYISAS